MRHLTRLDQQLLAVRSRWIVRDAVLASAWAILATVPPCLALGWLDYRMDFSRPVRVIELAGLFVWLVWVLRRFVVPAARRRRDTYAAALRVESVYERFGGRLVSRVEFRHPAAGGSRVVQGLSSGLIDAMCARVEQEASHLTLHDAIDLKPVRRPAVGAAAALLVLSLVGMAWPGLAGLWLQRTLWPFGDAVWPRRTQLAGVEPHYRVRRGDAVRITGRVTGERPWSGSVEWQPAGDARSKTQPAGSTSFDVASDGTFAVRIGPLLEPITLAIEVGDARLGDVAVDVVIPPELASIQAVYTYPEFTHRQPDRVQSGDVRALVGTRVDLTLHADRAAARMELAFSGDDGERVEPATLQSETHGETAFRVAARGRYQVRLYDAYGFSTDSPATFVIEPIDNELPTVRLTRPGSEHVATPATQLRLRFEAGDDYGVTAAVIRWRKRTAEEPQAPAPAEAVTIPVLSPRPQWAGQYPWDLALADLQAGDQIEYHVEVRDAGEHLTREKVGVSATHVLKIVEPEALRQSLEARLREAFGELDHLTQQQQAGRNEVEVAIVSYPTGDEPVMPADLRRLQIEQNRQTRLRRQAERLAERLEQLADQLKDSFLAEPDRIEDLRTLAGGLEQLATGPMNQAAEHLKRARSALAQWGALPDTGGN